MEKKTKEENYEKKVSRTVKKEEARQLYWLFFWIAVVFAL
jgi:hypothetical protein